MKLQKQPLILHYLCQAFMIGVCAFFVPFSLKASDGKLETDLPQSLVQPVPIYHISFNQKKIVIDDRDISDSLDQSYYIPWKSRVQFPVVIQAKNDIIFGARKLKAGKHITISYHLQNYKNLADCKGEQCIPLSEDFEEITEQTMIIDLIKRLKPDASFPPVVGMKELLGILDEKVKLEKKWTTIQFKAVDESEKNEIS